MSLGGMGRITSLETSAGRTKRRVWRGRLELGITMIMEQIRCIAGDRSHGNSMQGGNVRGSALKHYKRCMSALAIGTKTYYRPNRISPHNCVNVSAALV